MAKLLKQIKTREKEYAVNYVPEVTHKLETLQTYSVATLRRMSYRGISSSQR